MGKPHPGSPYFAEVGDALRENYLRYSFTKGTAQEVAFLLDVLRLKRGERVLDVGCGPGRHAIALAQAGLQVTGVDVSAGFLDVARGRAAEVDVAVSFFQTSRVHAGCSEASLEVSSAIPAPDMARPRTAAARSATRPVAKRVGRNDSDSVATMRTPATTLARLNRMS